MNAPIRPVLPPRMLTSHRRPYTLPTLQRAGHVSGPFLLPAGYGAYLKIWRAGC